MDIAKLRWCVESRSQSLITLLMEDVQVDVVALTFDIGCGYVAVWLCISQQYVGIEDISQEIRR